MHFHLPDPRPALDELLDATVVFSYTDVGPVVRRRLFHWEDLDARSLKGGILVVTGATSGLGLAAAQRMAAMGASLRLLVRDPGRGARAKAAILTHAPRADVDLFAADLGDLASVRAVVDEIRSREARVDVLVNNAGGIVPQRRLSPDGYELTFATMVLGPFALTNGLAPLLQANRTAGGRARVINVVSGGMYSQGLHVDDLSMEREPYRGSVAYARAKRAMVVLTEEWARRWRDRDVVVHAMHPGWADTPGIATALPRFRSIVGPRLRTADEGADTIVWLAASAEAQQGTGRLWLDRRPRPTVRLPGTRVSRADADRLWKICERLTADPRP
jgi:dehydrogenase/reductase SDR family protein 12